MSFKRSSLSTVAAVALLASPAIARDQVQVAGSSTVLPYASIVAEAFGDNTDFPTPVVESGVTRLAKSAKKRSKPAPKMA